MFNPVRRDVKGAFSIAGVFARCEYSGLVLEWSSRSKGCSGIS